MTVTRRWQTALVLIGLALLVIGGLVLLDDVNPKRYLGLGLWFAGALVIHDGLIAPLVFGVDLMMRRVGRRVPLAVLLIVQGAIVVGAIVALLVFPEIAKKNIGTANPTLLPLDYTGNLVGFYVVLAVLTAAAVAGYCWWAARRQKLRSPSSQA
ncbi:MAG: hypothetical protein JWM51_473 [Microbacteriaceae bacterium]|jgi:hypothetical protein|nr:hypothetical protein [Microbacteriaceae bacterium]